MLSFRLFDPPASSYEPLVALYNAIWPSEPRTVDWYQYADAEREREEFFQRWLGLADNRLVAVGEIGLEDRESPGAVFLSLDVHPEHRRQGFGHALYGHLCKQLEGQAYTSVKARTREDHPEAIRFLKKRGFRQEIREPGSALDLTQFDWTRFADRQERFAAQDIQIESLADLSQTVPDWQYRYYAVWKAVRVDVPSAAPVKLPSFETYCREALANPGFNLQGQFIALDGETWVGCASIWTPPPATGKVYTGLTGVIRSHRCRGIAFALKLQTVRFAQEIGAHTISTSNEENNPMYQINLKLGFQPLPAWLGFRLDRRTESGG